MIEFNEKGTIDLIRKQLVDQLQLTWDEASDFSNEVTKAIKASLPKEPRLPWYERFFKSFDTFSHNHPAFIVVTVIVMGLWSGLMTTFFTVGEWPWYIIVGVWLTIVLTAGACVGYVAEKAP